MKKLLSVLFCIVFVFAGLCSCSADGIYTTEDKYFIFTECEGGYKIAANVTEDYPKTIRLPEEHNGAKVVAIEYGGFKNCVDLEKVIIPESITKIGGDAFSGLAKLHNVNFVDNEATETVDVDFGAFSDCIALTEINFGKKVKNVGAYAFKNTRILRAEFTLVESIGDYAFKDCSSLSYVYIPATLKAENIGELAPFYGCDKDIDFVIDEKAKENGVTLQLLVAGPIK